MNGLEEIRENIENFICEKKQVQQQIAEIEEKRTQLAQERNANKKVNSNSTKINELGKQISELGNQSQELQNKLDFRFGVVKTQINQIIDNLIAEGIRKIRKINEEIQELESKIANQKERNARYQLQKQEFYLRFGRMPELSENAIQESKLQEKENKINESKIQKLELQIEEIGEEIAQLAKTNRDFKNGSWNFIKENKNEVQEIYIEELNVEEIESIEDIYIEELSPIEELHVEEFQPIEEIHIEELQVEELKTVEEIESVKNIELQEEKCSNDKIEELAKSIVEEIVAEQTKEINIKNIETQNSEENTTGEVEEEIIIFEEKNQNKDQVIIPLFGKKATISNIIVKFEETELVYKAKMSDGNEIKIYPAKIGTENVLLRDQQNREECKEILINYAISEYKILDKKVINKIDPLICELLIECAEKYNYDAQKLIYNYAMSFSIAKDVDAELVPSITYNLSYLDGSKLSKKEKAIINKICKNARKNNKIDIIEPVSKFRRIKYILRRIFTANNIKLLPDSKYE